MLQLERAYTYYLDNIANFIRVLKEFKTFSTIIHLENKHFKVAHNKAASIPVKIYVKIAAFYPRMINKNLYVLSLLYSD